MRRSTPLLRLVLLRQRQPQITDGSFRSTLPAIGRKRRDRRITRRALQSPLMSSFNYLFSSGCEQSLITLTGFDYNAFHYMLTPFTELYRRYSPYSVNGSVRLLPTSQPRRGRPRSMNATQCLGLVLTWTRTRGSEMVLCMLFGITTSVCSFFIRFGRRVLLRILSSDDNAAVKMHNFQEIEEYKSAICTKYSLLHDVFAVADGVKIYLEQSGDVVIQNMFYNGWQHDHYVSNVLVFAPSGIIIACALNAPGAMHDSTIAEWGNVYGKLETTFHETGAKCVVDSAFSKGNYPFLIKSSQDHVTNTNNAMEVVKMKQATSARQASEWGMRAFQGSFPRMKDRLVYEDRGERKLIILTSVLLFNLRSRLVGINQILSSFMPHLSQEANGFIAQHGKKHSTL